MKNFDEYDMNECYEYDIPVGETFSYKGKTLKVVLDKSSYSCNECFFGIKNDKCYCRRFACFAVTRLDGKDVIFEEVKNDKKEG